MIAWKQMCLTNQLFTDTYGTSLCILNDNQVINTYFEEHIAYLGPPAEQHQNKLMLLQLIYLKPS